jgi:mono/diheme cytochrome c family protein
MLNQLKINSQHRTFQTGISTILAVFYFTLFITCGTGFAADDASIARGGRLFDNWFLELNDYPPTNIHPNYNNSGSTIDNPEDSWRCIACHGWDYNGMTDQQTEPISGGIGGASASLSSILKDEKHLYVDMFSEHDLTDLTAFINDGLIDLPPYIERGSNRALGDATREVALYETICANCHGADGRLIKFIEPLGTYALHNAREALHKILNGHPGERMPPMRFLKTKRVSDLFAYIQTLPSKNLLASITRGGRLYDHWSKETGVNPPNYRHPAYPKAAKRLRTYLTSWRCKECHGWDYKGSDGVYKSGIHRTGIKGIQAFSGGNPQTVIKIMMDENHRYYGLQWDKPLFNKEDLIDLANFVTQGQINTDTYIDRTTGAIKGNPKPLKNLFNVLCATCHGVDGKALATGFDIGDTARKNPWETLHKMRNGHPDETMPALQALDISILAGILAYAQTLP